MAEVCSAAINGRLVWAVVVALPAEHRLRVSADDWEALGIGRGEPVTVEAPGRPTVTAFVRVVTFVEPCWVWVLLDPQVAGGPPVKPRRVGGRVT
jgi:hypothetical protein